MTALRITAMAVLLACSAQAVLNKDFKRREAFDSYGPPPRPSYGPPPSQSHQPHREYGVPQKIPFREYGPPSIKYGPPKLNFIGGGGGIGGSSSSFGGGLHEQIKNHFGVPKPFYGPPHVPKPSYGPPPPRPQAQYGPPPPRPQGQYGPPPPRPSYGPPPAQSLPSTHPGPLFKPALGHAPATSYGPPPSGPLNQPPRPNYGPPPKPSYGPPQLPAHLPGPQPASFNRVPETTIILTGGSGSQGGHHNHNQKQVQIQIDASGHTHSVSGSQTPFHTACDGWKPIPAPVGAVFETNHVDTQAGYSQVSHGSSSGSTGFGATGFGTGSGANFGTQYSVNSGSSSGSGGSIVDGLTDEQLVAVALQSGGFDGPQTIRLPAAPLPPTGPAGDFQQHGLNSLEAEALQISLGAVGDSYSRPPPDSFAPGSIHAQKYNTIGGNYGPPPPPSAAAFVQHHHQHHQEHHHEHQHSSAAQAGLGIQYGTQSGNLRPLPTHGAIPPSKPVSFRPPVPQGLLESIGATVQHLDQFGVKPQNQPPTYIPPATSDVAQSGPGNVGPEYGAPPQVIVEQQLPQHQPAPVFVQEQHQQQQQQQHGVIDIGPSPVPQQQYLPPPPPPAPQQQYLPPQAGFIQQQQQQQQQYHQQQHQASSNVHVEQAFSSGAQFNHQQQFVHTQGLPVPQEARFNQGHSHDCGHGPNLVGASYQFQQQQQQQQQIQQHQQIQQQQQFASSGSYNSIAQSIPVAEQHTQFISGPADSYGPPASGNDIDHIGYASQKSAVATLPDGTDPQNLPGLDGLNVISAQKSHSIQLSSGQEHQGQQVSYQVQVGGQTQSADHDEILSQGLLQSILTAIEQPSSNSQQQQVQQPRTNELAQSRSDTDVHEDATEDDENEPAVAESNPSHVQVAPDSDVEEPATVTELKAIVPEEESAAADDDDEARK